MFDTKKCHKNIKYSLRESILLIQLAAVFYFPQLCLKSTLFIRSLSAVTLGKNDLCLSRDSQMTSVINEERIYIRGACRGVNHKYK